MTPLVLSLFPGIGLLDRAFEEEGFCVVRGPDLLWGGDVKRFHPPAGKFDGVIGGPPCQMFSSLVNLIRARGNEPRFGNLIPEFERCIAEAGPLWFLMENVEAAPMPVVIGYRTTSRMVRDVWVGGETNRLRRFTLGMYGGRVPRLVIDGLALHCPNPEPAVVGSNGGPCTDRRSGGAIRKTRNKATLPEARRLQGIPADLDLSALTVKAQIQAVGNGVPLPMGRAIAKAVKQAMGYQVEGAA